MIDGRACVCVLCGVGIVLISHPHPCTYTHPPTQHQHPRAREDELAAARDTPEGRCQGFVLLPLLPLGWWLLLAAGRGEVGGSGWERGEEGLACVLCVFGGVVCVCGYVRIGGGVGLSTETHDTDAPHPTTPHHRPTPLSFAAGMIHTYIYDDYTLYTYILTPTRAKLHGRHPPPLGLARLLRHGARGAEAVQREVFACGALLHGCMCLSGRGWTVCWAGKRTHMNNHTHTRSYTHTHLDPQLGAQPAPVAGAPEGESDPRGDGD